MRSGPNDSERRDVIVRVLAQGIAAWLRAHPTTPLLRRADRAFLSTPGPETRGGGSAR